MNIRILLSVFFLIILSTGNSAYGLEPSDIKIHGFLSQGYLQTDHNNYLASTEDGTFQFNEFGLNFKTRLTDDLKAGIQFFGRDMGTVGNDEVRVDWAFLDYRWRDWAGLRIGKPKLVFGLYNEIREVDMLRTQVLLPQSVYVEVFRDALASIKGIDFYGDVEGGAFGDFSYQFQYGALTLNKGDGASQIYENNQSAFKVRINEIESDMTWALALTWDTPLNGLKLRYSTVQVDGLRLSGSASASIQGIPVSTFAADLQGPGRFEVVSAEYTRGNLILAGEYMEVDSCYLYQYGPIKILRNSPLMGWYVSGSYRFNDLFSLGLSYSEYYPNANDKDGSTQVASGRKDFQGWQKTWTASTRFDLNRFWVFKLEASYNDGFGASQPAYNNPADLEPYWWLFAAKATVSF